MAAPETKPQTALPTVNLNNGFCHATRTFHSLRPKIPLPPPSQPTSVTDYLLSLLPSSSSSSSSTTFLVDAATDRRVPYADFIRQCCFLSSFLTTHFPLLSKNDVALVLPTPAHSLHVPVVYFSLLSLGITVSPANPLSSPSELAHLVQLSKPTIAFATSDTAPKLPSKIRHGVILLDSPEFASALTAWQCEPSGSDLNRVIVIEQSDPATILYSSGTTGRVKGVLMTHRNMIASIAGALQTQSTGSPGPKPPQPTVTMLPLPLFHVYGFVALFRAFAAGETVVLMGGKFDLGAVLRAVEKYRVGMLPVSPPVVVALVKSEEVIAGKYDLSSLQRVACGGAPLGREVSERFSEIFPHMALAQGYALTESGAGTAMKELEETKRLGSVGRLLANMEAKIVDPATGESQPPGCKGELWLRGPTIMKGYVGDDRATVEILDSDGWLKTGDLCYFDSDGYLFIIDRLKELIKYKGYQVPPAELEHLLQSHPQIADAAVIPYPDEEAGQIPMAFVVRKPGGDHITESEVISFIAKQVAPYKKIRRVAFVGSIPKSPAGKILRRELINHAVSGGSARL